MVIYQVWLGPERSFYVYQIKRDVIYLMIRGFVHFLPRGSSEFDRHLPVMIHIHVHKHVPIHPVPSSFQCGKQTVVGFKQSVRTSIWLGLSHLTATWFVSSQGSFLL